MGTDEDIYKASPQINGTNAHEAIDQKVYSHKKNILLALPIISEELGVFGKIDTYKAAERTLIEKKYQLKQIYQGQIYQLWAQYFCMVEMGYEVEKICFYEISTNKTIPIKIPTNNDKDELIKIIDQFKNFNPESEIKSNNNKCIHCIYCSLCDKFDAENVYT